MSFSLCLVPFLLDATLGHFVQPPDGSLPKSAQGAASQRLMRSGETTSVEIDASGRATLTENKAKESEDEEEEVDTGEFEEVQFSDEMAVQPKSNHTSMPLVDMELLEATTTGFKECHQGDACNCHDGILAYGKGKKWVSHRVSGMMNCSAELFQATANGTCRCYSLAWCHDHEAHDEVQTDTAHRRRANVGTQGAHLWQRRRFCGWGARNCEWSSWGGWSHCSTTCGEGRVTRTRAQTISHQNGGSCAGWPSETQKCIAAEKECPRG